MIICENIKGNEADPQTARKLHEIEHRGELHTLILASEDMQRHRIRGTTEQGLECAIALPRDVSLQDGAVVHMGEDLAIVVRARPTRWIAMRPRDAAAALELGYVAGNMHWKVRFDGERIEVAQWGTEADILNRVRHLTETGQVSIESAGVDGD